MSKDKIKILSVGENVNTLSSILSADASIDEYFSFIQENFEDFPGKDADFNVLFFTLKITTIDSIIGFYKQTYFKHEPAVVLFCDDIVSEEEVARIPFENKLVFRNSVTVEELKHNISVVMKKAELEKKIKEFEERVGNLHGEIENLKTELDANRINIEELSQTNFHLATATWRERANKSQLVQELEEVKKENEFNKLNINELTSTNEHLIAATWRERDLKKQLKEAIDEINQSKSIIEDQNKRIEQSINYARKLQHAIHTTESDIKAILPQSFMYFKPKDVISGDFPWMFQKGDYVYIAAVDCTGHGVPGAMMSMIGNLLLNDLAHENGEFTPAQILDSLHKRVIKTLKQDTANSNANDGMDIAMIRLHKKTNEVVFASAHRPLVHITKSGETTVIKGDKFPIGGLHYEKLRVPFTDTYISIEKDDMLFLFTDGLTDQVGGEEGKKIGTNSVFKMLSSMLEDDTKKIQEHISSEFESWKGNNKQIDDVLLIALKY